MKDAEETLMLSVVILVVCLIAGAAYFKGWESGQQTRKEAVQRGFATWVSDENGNTTFTWKEQTP